MSSPTLLLCFVYPTLDYTGPNRSSGASSPTAPRQPGGPPPETVQADKNPPNRCWGQGANHLTVADATRAGTTGAHGTARGCLNHFPGVSGVLHRRRKDTKCSSHTEIDRLPMTARGRDKVTAGAMSRIGCGGWALPRRSRRASTRCAVGRESRCPPRRMPS